LYCKCHPRARSESRNRGARSRSTRTLTGLAIGAYLGLMAGFPLLAIGLATS